MVYNELAKKTLSTRRVNLINLNSTPDTLSSTGGIVLAGKIFSKSGLSYGESDTISKKERQVLTILAGLQVQGRTRFAEIEQFRHDQLFRQALNLSRVYAPDTLRLYVEQIVSSASGRVHAFLDQVNLNLLQKVKLTSIVSQYGRYIPVDVDVSPLDNSRSHKEGVSRTYKGHDGYAPIFSYIGTEGYMLDQQLRPGKQHCQKETPEYLQANLEKLEKLQLDTPILFRLDSGNDAFDTLKVLADSPHYFLIKRNLRREPHQKWIDIAEGGNGSCYEPRPGKIVYTGVLTTSHPKAKEDSSLALVDQVYRVTIRSTDHEGNAYLFPKSEVEVYWTNLYEDPETVIELYHDHATSEQFHSELKTDMNFERLPSGKLSVNKLLLHIAMISFNTLRCIGQAALEHEKLLPYRHKGKRKRLRKVIDDIIRVAGKVVTHARSLTLKIWDHDPWYPVFNQLYLQL